MKPLVILTDTRRMGQCRSCGAPIEWATVAATSKPMPFNPPIITVPVMAFGVDDVVMIHYAEVDRDRTVSHFATCPDHKEWRKRRR